MKSLTAEQIAYLAQYGFDESLLASWRQAVRQGRLSLANNQVRGPILAAAPDAFADLPRRGTAAANELEALGRDAIGRGQLGVVILNGGMATRFGGVVKGVVEVLPGRSFLALKLADVARAERACGGAIQVFVMNSFATDQATRDHLAAHDGFGLEPSRVHHFNQFVSVRLQPNGDLFLDADGKVSPYGPGHGDFAPAFRASGCLERFLRGGGQHLFVANVDNLGARVSPLVLGHHLRSRAEVTVELAAKWPGDVGGAPYVVDGRLQLLERLRYPEAFDPDIVDVFNTNTFHFRAAALQRDFDLGWHYVEKTVDGRKAVQIERLIGELTGFLTTSYVRVERTGAESRFLPIKEPQDLEAARDEIAAMYGEAAG